MASEARAKRSAAWCRALPSICSKRIKTTEQWPEFRVGFPLPEAFLPSWSLLVFVHSVQVKIMVFLHKALMLVMLRNSKCLWRAQCIFLDLVTPRALGLVKQGPTVASLWLFSTDVRRIPAAVRRSAAAAVAVGVRLASRLNIFCTDTWEEKHLTTTLAWRFVAPGVPVVWSCSSYSVFTHQQPMPN